MQKDKVKPFLKIGEQKIKSFFTLSPDDESIKGRITKSGE